MQFISENSIIDNITRVIYYKRSNLDEPSSEYEFAVETDIKIITSEGELYNSLSNVVENLYYNPDDPRYTSDMVFGHNTSRIDIVKYGQSNYLFIKAPSLVTKIMLYSGVTLCMTIDMMKDSGTQNELKNSYLFDKVIVLDYSGAETRSELPLVKLHELFTHNLHKTSDVLYSRSDRAILSKKLFDIITNTYDLDFRNNTLISNDYSKYYIGNRIAQPTASTLVLGSYKLVCTDPSVESVSDLAQWLSLSTTRVYDADNLQGRTPTTGDQLIVDNGGPLQNNVYLITGSPELGYVLENIEEQLTFLTSDNSGYVLNTSDAQGFVYKAPINGILFSYESPLNSGDGYTRYYYIKNYYIDSELERNVVPDNPIGSGSPAYAGDNNVISDYIRGTYPKKTGDNGLEYRYVLSGAFGNNRTKLTIGATESVTGGMNLYSDKYTTYGDRILYPNKINKFEI